MIWLLLLLIAPPVGWLAHLIYLEYRSDRVPILLYHRFIDEKKAKAGEIDDDEMIWVVYDDEFERQMDWLADNGYTPLNFDEYVEIRAGRRPLPDKPVILTMDDGYTSNYDYAFPALAKHGFTATIYVALEPEIETRTQVEGIDGFLSPAQLRELSDGGVSIQSHTLTHRILTELDDDEVRHELSESRKKLEEIIAKPVRHFCIPRGGFDRRIGRLIAESGYETTCGNAKGSANGLCDPLQLPRVTIERDMDVADFERALQPARGVWLRIIGETKKLPNRLLGARRARDLRRVLYQGWLKPLFQARNLRIAIGLVGVLYLAAMGLLAWWFWG